MRCLEPDAVVLDRTIARGARVIVEGGVVRDVGLIEPVGERVELSGTLAPGFVDLQVNGAAGHSADEATPDALEAIAAAVFAGGAVAFLPTVITAPFDTLCQQVAAIARWIETTESRARPLGIHVEGPFLEVAGAHDPALFVDPTPERVDALLDAAHGRLALVTLAPARAGAVAATERLVAAGVTVSIGHAATTDRLADCIAAGATKATHLFNAMGAIHHRDPGMSGAVLDAGALACGLIADGVHVHPAMVRNAFRCLGVDRTILVTDCTAAMGRPDGDYRLGSIDVRVVDGVVRDRDGRLAGSALTMSRAAQNFAAMTAVGPWSLARACATNPAVRVRADGYGTIRAGAHAAFTLITDDGCEALAF